MKTLYVKLKDEIAELPFNMSREELIECVGLAAIHAVSSDAFSIGKNLGHIKLTEYPQTFDLRYFNIYEDEECKTPYNILNDEEINPYYGMRI